MLVLERYFVPPEPAFASTSTSTTSAGAEIAMSAYAVLTSVLSSKSASTLPPRSIELATELLSKLARVFNLEELYLATIATSASDAANAGDDEDEDDHADPAAVSRFDDCLRHLAGVPTRAANAWGVMQGKQKGRAGPALPAELDVECVSSPSPERSAADVGGAGPSFPPSPPPTLPSFGASPATRTSPSTAHPSPSLSPSSSHRRALPPRPSPAWYRVSSLRQHFRPRQTSSSSASGTATSGAASLPSSRSETSPAFSARSFKPSSRVSLAQKATLHVHAARHSSSRPCSAHSNRRTRRRGRRRGRCCSRPRRGGARDCFRRRSRSGQAKPKGRN